MDIQSFILGMSAVLVIALVIGSFFAVVKVIKISKEFREIQIWVSHEFENLRKEGEQSTFGTNQQIQEVYRTMDSRFDKQYEKIMKELNPNKAFLSLIGKMPKETDAGSTDNETYKSAKRIMDKLDKQ